LHGSISAVFPFIDSEGGHPCPQGNRDQAQQRAEAWDHRSSGEAVHGVQEAAMRRASSSGETTSTEFAARATLRPVGATPVSAPGPLNFPSSCFSVRLSPDRKPDHAWVIAQAK